MSELMNEIEKCEKRNAGGIDRYGKFKATAIEVQNYFRSPLNGKVYLNHKDLNDIFYVITLSF